MDEPLAPDAARKLIRQILQSRSFAYTEHAKQEMIADDLSAIHCELVLRSGIVRPGEYERGTWRYRVESWRVTVVIAFQSKARFIIVTAWRAQP